MEETHSLDYAQVDKLYRVLTQPIDIYPNDNFPTLSIAPADFLKVVRARLVEKDIQIRDIRMNGSAASYCLCKDSEDQPPVRYNDIDLIFGVSIERENDFHVIKEEVLTSLLDFFPEGVAKKNIGTQLLEETYMKKMILVSDANNRWSLFSIGQSNQKVTIELKFVSEIKRRFEFTVDSFQIILDSYIDFGRCTKESGVPISPTFFPSVQSVSVYSDYPEALEHLNGRLIHTVAPEEIRGGGLLKYCTLLVNGYKPAYPEKMESLEPYMCSRFFIDFPSSEMQYTKIMRCIENRFLQRGDVQASLNFLDVLYRTVSCQARCLMESQRFETISVIMRIRDMIVYSYSWYYHPLPPPYIPISGFSGPNVSSSALSTASYHHHNTMSTDYHYRHHHHGNTVESSRTSPPPPTHHYRNSRSRRPFHHRGSSNGSRSRSISPQNEPWNSQSLPTAQQAEVRS